jgi:hypothetical protein
MGRFRLGDGHAAPARPRAPSSNPVHAAQTRVAQMITADPIKSAAWSEF